MKVCSLLPSVISVLAPGAGGACEFTLLSFTRNCLRKKLNQTKTLNLPQAPRLAPSRPVYPSTSQPRVGGRGRDLFVGSVSTSFGHAMASPAPCHHTCAERGVTSGDGATDPRRGLCPEAPSRRAAGPAVSVLGSPGGAGPQRPPKPAVRSPGGCSSLEGGGERQAGAEAGLGRPPPLAFRLPPPGSVPAAPRPGVGPHARGRSARGSSSACPRQGWFCQEYVGTPTERHPPITPQNLLCHHAPKQRQPPKSEWGVCSLT